MPGVAEIQITTPQGTVDNFDIKAQDTVVGKCNANQSELKRDYTRLNCTITASDISEYQSFSGYVEFVVIVIGGGTVDYIPYGSKGTTGENALSFYDGEVTGTVKFDNTQVFPCDYALLFRETTAGYRYIYFLAPIAIYNQKEIRLGTFYISVDFPTGGVLDTTRTSGYTTSKINKFEFSMDYQELSGASERYSNGGTKYTVNFGKISSSEYFWINSFY